VKRGHRELRAWQRAVALVETIYRITDTFPKTESYGLAQQMRRAAVSVPSNLAEGAARKGSKELIHFASIAGGSLAELDTQIELARRLGFLKVTSEVQAQIDEVAALVLALIEALRRKVR
jgi:four helix bundle protein